MIQFIHPLDQTLSDTLLNSAFGNACTNLIFSDRLDEATSYLYSSTYMKLSENSVVYDYFKKGCNLFELNEIPEVYITRQYAYDVSCTGFRYPIVCVPNILLEKNNSDILCGRMMAAAASIKVGHHKLTFLSWVYHNFNSILKIPFLDTGIRTTINQWFRAQFYTLDRAFFISTRDKKLTLQNILYGQAPSSLVEHSFREVTDPFEKQVDEFNSLDKVTDYIALVNGFLQSECFLTERYDNVKKFMGGGICR